MMNFDKSFWENFINKSDNFSTTCVLENAFGENDKNLLFEGATEAFYTRIIEEIYLDGFRIWLDNELLTNNELKKICQSNKPKNNEHLLSYCKRVFGNKFGVIINNNECFSEKLASRIAEIIKPLCDLVGIPPLGYEITIFIGNYGWTPLGIHKDSVGENVFHFHLGPGRKQMYNWDDEEYEKIVGEKVYNNQNIEPIIDSAKKYDFGKGDLYFMPWFKNHVGYSGEFSVGVSLWFRNSNNSVFSKKLIQNFISQFISKDERIIPPQINYLTNDDTFEMYESTVSKYMDKPDATLKEFLHNTYMDFKYCLMSNEGWKSTPKENNIENTNHNFFKNKKIKAVKPFKLLYRNNFNNTKLYIYVRGNRIRIKYFEDIVEFIDKLNDGISVDINEVLKAIEIPEEVFLYLTSILYKYKGISIVDS